MTTSRTAIRLFPSRITYYARTHARMSARAHSVLLAIHRHHCHLAEMRPGMEPQLSVAGETSKRTRHQKAQLTSLPATTGDLAWELAGTNMRMASSRIYHDARPDWHSSWKTPLLMDVCRQWR